MKVNVEINYNEINGNKALYGSSIFIQRLSEGEFDFENNYWGSNTPNLAEEMHLNNVCNLSKSWLKKVNSTIKVNDLKRGYNSIYDFSATFLNNYGLILKNKTVVFNVNNKNYTILTDLKGIGKLVLKLDVGSYQIKIFNIESSKLLVKNVEIVKRIIENRDLSNYYLNCTYKVRITGDDGNYVGKGVVVTFKIGNAIYNVKTDKNGYASLKITKKSGKYTVIVSYKGEVVRNNVIIKKNLYATNMLKKKAKIINYSVLLKSHEKNKKISFKINKNNYIRKTNSKGKSILKLKNLKPGKYRITVKYKNESVKKYIKIFR